MLQQTNNNENYLEAAESITTIRNNAREDLESGAVTSTYAADKEKVIQILNESLATELVCVLRYKTHYEMAKGINSASIAADFLENANKEQEHADRIAKRISQLGGIPNYCPAGLSERSHTDYVEGTSLRDMIKENLIAERIVISLYQQFIRYIGNDDPTTRCLFEQLLADEEEHANELSNMLSEDVTKTLDLTIESTQRGTFMNNGKLKTILMLAVIIGLQSTIAQAASRGVLDGTVFERSRSSVINVAGGIITGDLAAMPGVDLQIATKVSSDLSLYAGAELALFVLTGKYASPVVVPVLGTAFVEFNLGERIHPVLGASFGPTISTGNQFSAIRMTFLVNPGINFYLRGGLDLNVLARFGVMGSSFVVLPQVGLTIAI